MTFDHFSETLELEHFHSVKSIPCKKFTGILFVFKISFSLMIRLILVCTVCSMVGDDGTFYQLIITHNVTHIRGGELEKH